MDDVTGCPSSAGFLCDKAVALREMVKGASVFMFSPVKLTSSEYTRS
jgi:hypothetical protein